jgi:hypothetical protein
MESIFFFQGLLNERDQENVDLKNELNILKEQMPTTGSEDDDIVMRAVEERVKQWKVSLNYGL